MAFHPAVNCAEIVVMGTRDGENVFNTFYAQKAEPYIQDDINDLADAVDQWVADEWLPIQPNDYIYVHTVVRGLTSEVDLTATNGDSAGNGAKAGSSLTNNATLAVKRSTGHTGRAARGRVYLPPISSDYMATENTVSTGFVTLVEDSLNALASAMSDVNWVEVVLHRVSGGVPLSTAVIYTVLEYIVVDRVIDSMRRRLPGRGS